jgi:hypothetical protein
VQILSAFEYLDADCMREATRYGILFETKDGLSCPHNCLQILSAFEYLDADCMRVATRYGILFETKDGLSCPHNCLCRFFQHLST